MMASKNFKSDLAFKSFHIEQKSEEVVPTVAEQMDALVDECKGINTDEKFFEEKNVDAVSSVEVVSDIVQEPVVETPDIQIVEEPKCEPEPDVKVEEIPVVEEVAKPAPKITILRRGGLPITDGIKAKALLFSQGKSY